MICYLSFAVIPKVTVKANRFATRSYCFMDAYQKGLDGKQAAWAGKKYCGHQVLPTTLLDDLSKACLNNNQTSD